MPWTKPYKPASNQPLAPEMYEDKSKITFITIRAYQNQKPFVENAINQMVIDTMLSEQQRLNCRVYIYCLMPDHIHFLISPEFDGASVLNYVNQFKGKTTNLSWKVGWNSRLWQPRFYDHIIRSDENLRAISEYIITNPVRKGFTSIPDDWPWNGILTPLPL